MNTKFMSLDETNAALQTLVNLIMKADDLLGEITMHGDFTSKGEIEWDRVCLDVDLYKAAAQVARARMMND